VLRSEVAAEAQRRLNALEADWRRAREGALADAQALHAARLKEVGGRAWRAGW
jgi:hypothetical protein